MATIHDVSALANVSIATVSRVFNNTAKVKAETQKVVLDAARQLGYLPDKIDSVVTAKAAVKSQSIGLLISNLSKAQFGQFYLVAQQHALQERMQLTVFNGEGSKRRERNFLQVLYEHGCQVILLVGSDLSESEVTALTSPQQQIICFDNGHFDAGSSMLYDHAQSTLSACQFLAAHQHHDIAILAGDDINTQARVEGFRHATSQLNLNQDE
ncbi:LacI family DNA-binding transcriptional regulator [Vibrio sp. 10N.286.52.B1]|uniref:LacI family DNA-binding transcriptional regulator n=1 Tax=Vibrio sp. 10N.286.52.B1 TaxID=3229712 RepID=UPI003550555F